MMTSWIDPVQDVDRPIEMAEIVHPTLGGGILLLDKDSGWGRNPGLVWWVGEVSFGMVRFGMFKGRSLFWSFPGRNFEDYHPRIISFRSILSDVISPLRPLNNQHRCFFSQLDEIRVWKYTYIFIYIYRGSGIRQFEMSMMSTIQEKSTYSCMRVVCPWYSVNGL